MFPEGWRSLVRMTENSEYTRLERLGLGTLVNIFIRSLSIQSSWNFSRMQNVAFAFSLIPLAKKMEKNKKETVGFLTRHIELFNTHPYLTGPIIGSVVKLEEQASTGSGDAARQLKKALTGPYAAMADPFFSGALKPATALVAVMLAMEECIAAPIILLLLFNPVHIWVRLRGFIEGYRDEKGGMIFLRSLNLPEMSRRIRWISVVLLGIVAGMMIPLPPISSLEGGSSAAKLMVLVIVLACYVLLRKRISQLMILYGSFIVFLIITVL